MEKDATDFRKVVLRLAQKLLNIMRTSSQELA